MYHNVRKQINTGQTLLTKTTDVRIGPRPVGMWEHVGRACGMCHGAVSMWPVGISTTPPPTANLLLGAMRWEGPRPGAGHYGVLADVLHEAVGGLGELLAGRSVLPEGVGELLPPQPEVGTTPPPSGPVTRAHNPTTQPATPGSTKFARGPNCAATRTHTNTTQT